MNATLSIRAVWLLAVASAQWCSSASAQGVNEAYEKATKAAAATAAPCVVRIETAGGR